MNKAMDSNGDCLGGHNIPYEVLSTILGYVFPHKSILQCRMVCKMWENTITRESWRYAVQQKKNQSEPYTDAEVKRISKLPWFLHLAACTENSIFGKNFVKTKVNAGRQVWKLLNSDSPDWQIVTDDELALSPNDDELSNRENIFSFKTLDEDNLKRTEQIIGLPSCGLTSFIIRELKPEILISFWIFFEETCPMNDVLYEVMLSLLDSAGKNDLMKFSFQEFGPFDETMSGWKKITMSGQFSDFNSNVNGTPIGRISKPNSKISGIVLQHDLKGQYKCEITSVVISIEKPNILAVDWWSVILQRHLEKRNESFALVVSPCYPILMTLDIYFRGKFSPNLLPIFNRKKQERLDLFTCPESGILVPGIRYGRAFADILTVKNPAENEDANESMSQEHLGNYTLLYEPSSQISLREYSLYDFLMDEFQPRIEAYIDNGEISSGALEMKYEMTVSLLDNEGKILHQKQGSEILRKENSKKLSLTFEIMEKR